MFLTQGRRDEAREGGGNRCHLKFALASQNLLLEGGLTVDPALLQRAAMAVNVAHPMPRKKRGTGEIALDLGVRKAVSSPNLLPDSLLAVHGERHVDTVQGHPVDLFLPARPVPPDG